MDCEARIEAKVAPGGDDKWKEEEDADREGTAPQEEYHTSGHTTKINEELEHRQPEVAKPQEASSAGSKHEETHNADGNEMEWWCV